MKTWFDRHSKRFEGDPSEQVHAWLHEAGVHEALNDMSGPIGVVRFLVFFQKKQGKIVVDNIASEPLEYGGGTPQFTGNQHVDELRDALLRFSRVMGHIPFSYGCVGFLRDYENSYDLVCYFDEDVKGVQLNVLPIPKYGHPLQDPTYQRLIGDMELQLSQVIAQSSRIGSNWEEWSIEKNTLTLSYPSEGGYHDKQKFYAAVLGTFVWSEFAWTWQVDQPLFREEAFSCKEFLATWEMAMELGYITTARLGAYWLFVGTLDDNTVLLASVWER